MRGIKAKALRKLTGFVPSEKRVYSAKPSRQRESNGMKFVVTGTITATGARRTYQDMK